MIVFSPALRFLACGLMGYSIGCINPSFLFAKHKGYDARKDGSGNVGASNAYILAGKGAFFISMFFDIFKAFFSFRISLLIALGTIVAGAVGGVACIIGHMYPVTLKFKGGKGLACMGGVILAWNWKVFLILLAVAVLIFVCTRYLCFVAPSISLIFPVIYYVMTRDLASALIFLIPAIPIVVKHVPNFKRIQEGTEARITYLWNKGSELERMNRDVDGNIMD